MTRIPRRTFLKSTAVASAWWGGARVLAAPTDQVMGANGDVRMAVIGMGRQGSGHVSRLLAMPGVRVVAGCDPDQAAQDRAKRIAEEAGKKIDTYSDVRKLLERDDIDAVCVATAHHWHVLAAMWALQAGKHVYVEKPVSYNIWEGRQLANLAKKTGRVVQHGTQNRSDVGLREAFPWIREGHIGKIERVVGLCYRNRGSIGQRLASPLRPPQTVDYDLWLGPAEDLPMYRPTFHYDWHWVWNTGNGDLGNQGVHETDLIQWIRGDGALPRRVCSLGGRFGWNDAGETPNMQIAWYDYEDYPVHFEVRDLWQTPDLNASANFRGTRVGVVITCEGGEFRGGRGGGWIYDPDGNRVRQFKGDGGGGHMKNFMDAVRANDPALLRTDMEVAHRSATLCHLANISHQVGVPVSADAAAERLADHPFLQGRLEEFKEHLGGWNVDLAATPLTVGGDLEFDPQTERFSGGSGVQEANALVSRAYREPFRVEEIS